MEFSAGRLEPTLFEDPTHAVLRKKADVGLQNAEIRMWQDIVVEVCDVIPDIQSVADVAPSDDVVSECFVLRAFFHGLGKGAFDAAKAHDHAGPWPCNARRLPGVAVSQRVERDRGELWLKALRNGVHEPQQRSGGAALRLVDGAAAAALACPAIAASAVVL